MTDLPDEVRVRVWITEPDGREVEVEQAVPVPDHGSAHVLAALDSTMKLARSRYERQWAPAPPVSWTFHTKPGPVEHQHSWAHASSMGDPYRRCITCGAVEDVEPT